MYAVVALTGVLFAAGCDPGRVATTTERGTVRLAVPFVATGGSIAGQVESATGDLAELLVIVRVQRTGAEVFNRRFPTTDPAVTLPAGRDDETATVTVSFPLPDASGDDVLTYELRGFDALGRLIVTVGPGTVQIGRNGRATTVEAQAEYVGPGSTVTSVAITPRSITVAVGQVAAIGCVGNPGAQTEFPYRLASANTSIASVTALNAVLGNSPGTTEVTCERAFGARVADIIPVTVVPVGTPGIVVIQGAGQTGVAGAQLPVPIVVRVRGADGQLATGVQVSFQVTAGGGAVTPGSAATGADGTASTTFVLGPNAGTHTVTISVPSLGFSTSVNATATTAPGTIAGTVRDAANSALIAGAAVEVRAGTNVTTGPTAGVGTTDAQGAFSIPGLAPGTYTVRVVRTGYASFVGTFVVVSNQTTTVFVSLSQTLGAGQVRITLTWVAALDLDAHLRLPDQTFIFWANPGSCPSGIPQPCLQNDDIVPPGPETMLIGQQTGGTYTFFVHNFTADFEDRPSSDNSLALSGARVDVYVGAATTPTATFTVPNAPGKLWTVFNLNGTTITPVNTMSDADLVDSAPVAGGAGAWSKHQARDPGPQVIIQNTRHGAQ
jgi:hypothetical protein